MRKILTFTAVIIAFYAINTTAFALTVSPAKIEVTADPGQTINGEIELFNEQEGAKTFYTTFENFEPSGDSGAPSFIGATEGLATWLSAQDSVTIEPGVRTVVPYSISVPAGTEPGGYFAAVFFGSQAPESAGGGTVSIGGKIGVLVLLRVSGEVEEGGGLLDFGLKDDARLLSSLPATFSYRFNNTGGDRIVPLGDIKIKNTFRINTETLSANKNEGSVLPGSIRKFEAVWGETETDSTVEKQKGFFKMAGKQLRNFSFGWYTAELNVTWGATNQTASSNFSFFIIPWQLLLIVIVIIFVFGFIGTSGLKRYNRYIINQARMSQK